MEPCPACNQLGTFTTHEDRGRPTCRGCREKFCSDCCYGARYTCVFMQDRLQGIHNDIPMPPSPLLKRSLAEWRGYEAEEEMLNHLELIEVCVYKGRDYIFKLVRRDGQLWRVYGNEGCVQCGTVDIRYPEHELVYATRGFHCGECAKRLSIQ